MGKIIYVFLFLGLVSLVNGANLHGQIYDLELEPVSDVLVEINTVPKQQYLAKNGEYSFEVPAGDYILKASKGELIAIEEIKIIEEGGFVFDLFLFPSFEEEDKLLEELEEINGEDRNGIEKKGFAKYPLWKYLVALVIIIVLIIRVVRARRKYGKMVRLNLWGWLKRKKGKKENREGGKKEEEEGKKEGGVREKKEGKGKEEEEKGEEKSGKKGDEKDKKREEREREEGERERGEREEGENKSEEEPGYLERALKIIKKHEGRIYQKELRKEMMDLSEAKVSLILTELEHKGKIERVKRGRGKVVLLKEGKG